MAPSTSSQHPVAPLIFKVRRREPELILPAGPIPREIKRLSDIDDQEGLRFQIPVIQFYRNAPRAEEPAVVIRHALARALVFYYPFAGRLKEELPSRKLLVDCTEELGVLFIEADADVGLEDFGEALHPPFPCLEELLFDVPGSGDILNTPLLLIQVTRLKCGGFVFAIRLNHVMADATGLQQFMVAVGQLARGNSIPSVPPVWERHLLEARKPPRVSFPHREYERAPGGEGEVISPGDMVYRAFFFGPREISSLFRLIPPHLCNSTTFDILTAYLWRTRTVALCRDSDKEMQLRIVYNARRKCNPPLPRGYYGNVLAYPTAAATAGDLTTKPLAFALELVKQAKRQVTDEYIRSNADLMVIKGRPNYNAVRAFIVSDATRARFREVDFGWGKAVYGGTARVKFVSCFYGAAKNKKGEEGIIVPICLPAPAMARFSADLDRVLRDQRPEDGGGSGPLISAL